MTAISTNISLLRSFVGATATLNGGVVVRYPEFSSLVDLLRGAVGNNTPAGKQLTNIRKLVTGGGSSSSSSSSSQLTRMI